MRMSELADQVVSTKSGLAHQITQLEKNGMVSRSSCPSDDGGGFASLTEAGERLLDKVVPTHEAVVREYLLDHLSADQAEALTSAMCATRRHLRGG